MPDVLFGVILGAAGVIAIVAVLIFIAVVGQVLNEWAAKRDE